LQRKSGRHQIQQKKKTEKEDSFCHMGSLQNLDQIKVREKLPQVIEVFNEYHHIVLESLTNNILFLVFTEDAGTQNNFSAQHKGYFS
jgi:hypothetical protein